MNNSLEKSNIIDIDYYVSNDGPIIRIDTNSFESLRIFGDLFKALKVGDQNEVELSNIENVNLLNIDSFRFLVSPKESRQTVKIARTESNKLHAEWILSKEGWDDCIFWLSGFFKNKSPGHQYMTNGTDDDAIIVLAFQE